MKKNILILFMIGVLNACSSKQDSAKHQEDSMDHAASEHAHMSAIDPAARELMSIHDSIMLQMDVAMSLKSKIRSHVKTLDSLLAKTSDNGIKPKKIQADSLLSKLDKADKAMMDWMHHYKADTLGKLDDESKTAYIRDQRQQIEKVGKLMSESISEARQFVNP
ncbi:hypothetical protein DSL64_15820 [Dyadobacter luteus]|uniref:Viral A-type inclusion protein n=1 Tax=Dyadobacter luteus TaxID=2259619 RepID=A0A3D8YAL3_9BACT|nr:hypothetical protein [Dyadobacter luteus]REA60140.1 hypothetical protein DSL64_15820 [Dyadobacter luteus]